MVFAVLVTTSTSTATILPISLPEIDLDTAVTVTDVRAQRIDAYFAQWNLPLAGYGADFVQSADKYGIDPYLIAAIAMIESTGGKFDKNNNPFGWGNANIVFDSYEHAIDTVSRHLAGKDDNTDHYYANKTLEQKLYAYNSVNPLYQKKIKHVMNTISTIAVVDTTTNTADTIELAASN